MKKLTAGIFATLLAVVSVGAAHAEIASKGYVDQQVGTKADAATVSSLQGTVSGHTSQIGTINDTIGGYGDIVTHKASEFATSAQGAKADTAVQPADITNVERTTNKTTTLSAESTDAQYPSAKAVYDTIQAETSDIASSGDLSALTTRVGTLETASATHATKTELAGKQDKIAGAQLEALNSGITADKVEAYDGYATQISGKLDAATADGKYAAKSTEGVASTASTNAQSALTNIGTLTNLTTEAKTNTVAAINEVASEAAAAQTTATAAQGAAGTAQAAAEAAQGDVDALEVRVGTAESDIDGIQGQLENMATSETVKGLQTDVDGLKTSKLDKATYDSQVGTVSAGNMGTTATTVVTAIKEVAGEAEAAQSAASAADSKAQAAQSAAEAADSKAQAAQTTANAAIPAPTAACADPDNKCVLVSAGAGNYSWEVIARGSAE